MQVPKTLSRAPLLAILLTTALAPASRILAQDPAPFGGPGYQRGFAADQVYQFGEIDHINAFNGNLVLTIPIGITYPVGGDLSYQFVLTYNSNLWNVSFGGTTGHYYYTTRPARGFNAGSGWSLSFGRLSNETGSWIYYGADGAPHRFSGTLHVDDQGSAADVLYTRDGSYLRMKVVTGGREVEFPDGTVRHFVAPPSGPEWLLTQIRDAFGNWVTIDYRDDAGVPKLDDWDVWEISDSTGRSHRVEFEDGNLDYPKLVDTVELARFGTTDYAVYDFIYLDDGGTLVGNACPYELPVPTQLEDSRLWFLTGIVLPDDDQSRFSMSYEVVLPGLEICQPVSGQILNLTLPTLGKLAWVYRAHEVPRPNPPFYEEQWFYDMVIGVAERKVFDPGASEPRGTWVYDRNPTDDPQGVANEFVSTITDPLGHVTRQYFSVDHENLTPAPPEGWTLAEYGLPITRNVTATVGPVGAQQEIYLSTEIFDASDLVHPLRSTYVRYEQDELANGIELEAAQNSNRRLAAELTVYHDDSDRRGETLRSDFDGLGHYRTVETRGTFGAGDERSVTTNWNPDSGTYPPASSFNLPSETSPWVLDTYDRRDTTEGGVTAVEEFCFNDATGLLKRRRTLLGATVGSTDVLVQYLDSDSDGNIDRERYFGSDGASLTSDTCNGGLTDLDYVIDHTWSHGALASSIYKDGTGGSVLAFVDRDIDQSTALVAASRDPAGLQTAFTYDALGRLKTETPAPDHDARTEYTYTAAAGETGAKVRIQRLPNDPNQNDVLAESEIEFDGFGRVAFERRNVSDAMGSVPWNVRQTQYNARGDRESVSELGASPNPGKPTKFTEYDPFGRPGEIEPPDGPDHKVVLDYAGVSTTSRTVQIRTSSGEDGAEAENPVTTIEQYDRQGRLWRVTEPSGDAGAMVSTTYDYDVGSRLASVSTTATIGSIGDVTQTRTFVYDNLGFLRRETHPEKDGPVEYSLYDARGHAWQKMDGGSTLDFIFDRAERVTHVSGTVQVSEDGYSQLLLKYFEYGDDQDGNGEGKLIRADRHNIVPYDVPVFGGADFVVVEKYTYNGKGGRVSARTIERQGNDQFTQGFEWTELGSLKRLTYPSCFAGAPCSGYGAPVREVTYEYDALGLLKSVPGYASTISYHANEMLKSVAHTNDVTDRWTEDPDDMRRPARIYTERVATEQFDTGIYAYDGAGNIKAMGADDFVYDRVSRLRSAAVDIRGVPHTQTQSYDAFGNRIQVNGTTGPRDLNTDPQTNRLLGSPEVPVTYDVAGNLTQRGQTEYTYDALNMLQRLEAPGASPGPVDHVYVYTADDERIVVIDFDAPNTTNLWYLRDHAGQLLRQLQEIDQPTGPNLWQWDRDTIRRDGQLLATDTPVGLHHYHLDHLGTPRLITDSEADPVVWHDLLPFGEEPPAPTVPEDSQPYRFTGHERDQNGTEAALCEYPPDPPGPCQDTVTVQGVQTGTQRYAAVVKVEAEPGVTVASGADVTFRAGELIAINGDFDVEAGGGFGGEIGVEWVGGVGVELDYMHARYCSPVQGRFLSVDPAGESFDPRKPQSWNRYSYVQNRPLAFTDPTGEVLYFFGDELERRKLTEQANAQLFGVDLVIDPKTGEATLVANQETGTATPEQAAFRNVLGQAIGSAADINVNLVTGDSGVFVDQFASGSVDVADLAAFGPGPTLGGLPPGGPAVLAGAIAELRLKAERGLTSTISGHAAVHPAGRSAIESVSGFTRGRPDRSGLDPSTMSGIIRTPFSKGKTQMTVKIIAARGNVVKVEQ